MGYIHPRSPGAYATTEQEQMPYIQIDTHTWIVMRNPKEHPVAIIEHIPSTAGVSKYLVRRWDPLPSRRPLISMHDSLKAANRSVLWDNSEAFRRANMAVPDVRTATYQGPPASVENRRRTPG